MVRKNRFLVFLIAVIAVSGCLSDYSQERVVGDRFIEQEVVYDDLRSIIEIGDKLAYTVDGDSGLFIVYAGKEYGQQYDGVESVKEINGSLAYIAISDKSEVVVYNGEVLGRYRDVSNMKEVSGQLAYQVKDSSQAGWSFLVVSGRKVGTGYEEVGPPVDVNGTLAYRAVNNGSSFIVYGGEKRGEKYSHVYAPQEVNERLAYIAGGRVRNQLVIYNGSEAGKRYSGGISKGSITAISRELAYVASNTTETGGLESFIVYNGTPVGVKYDDIGEPIEAGGRLAYKAEEQKNEFIVWSGQHLGEEYGFILWNWKVLNGVPVYLAQEDGMLFAVVGEKERNHRYRHLATSHKIINGTLAYGGMNGEHPVVVYGGREINNSYDSLETPLAEVNNQLVFGAERNGQTYIVQER